jgi:hypothetical protein
MCSEWTTLNVSVSTAAFEPNGITHSVLASIEVTGAKYFAFVEYQTA